MQKQMHDKHKLWKYHMWKTCLLHVGVSIPCWQVTAAVASILNRVNGAIRSRNQCIKRLYNVSSRNVSDNVWLNDMFYGHAKKYNCWNCHNNLFINVYLNVYYLAITRATGYYFYSYDSTDVFDPNSLHPNNLIYHHNPISGCPASIQNITVNRLAQEIVFINKRPQDHISTCVGADLEKTTVEICEVKVMGKIVLTAIHNIQNQQIHLT